MPTAAQNHTPPTQRSAPQFSAAAVVAGFTVPVLAGVANPDAELIQLCADFHQQHRGQFADVLRQMARSCSGAQ
jgi:hypothetical protein